MASREVTRLKRLRLDRMTDDRLRTELQKAMENFASETEQLEKSNSTMQGTLRNLSAQSNTLNQRAASQAAELKQVEEARAKLAAENETLKAALVDADGGKFSSLETAEAAQTISRLEVEKLQLTSRLSGTEAALAVLQKADSARDVGRATIPTNELYSRMATEVSDAANKLPEGFAIDDVEIEVKGALGQEDGNIVIGLDSKQQISGESATRLKFTLRRAVSETRVE